MANPDDGYAHAVIETVRDMQHLVEEHKRAGDEGRATLLATIEAMVAALRTDVHKAITSLQLGQVDHKAAHEADRIERVTRQAQLSAELASIRKWMIIGLVGIALAVGGAAGIAIGRWMF